VDEVLAEAVLVHDPVGALSAGRAAAVEHERLAHAVDAAVAGDAPVLAGGLPVPRRRGAVGARPVGILAVARAEEEPLKVTLRQERLLCACTVGRQQRKKMISLVSCACTKLISSNMLRKV
jgi:hypothetical protein